MNFSPFTIKELATLITGDSKPPTRTGPTLVKLFNKFGFRDVYDEKGLPDIGKNNKQRPSRTQYVCKRLEDICSKPESRQLLNQILKEADIPDQMAEAMNSILMHDGFKVVLDEDDNYVIEGGVIDNRKPVENTAHFQEIQDKILQALDSAKVSIKVAMAWFTNEILRDKLVEKKEQGIEVNVVIYADGINKVHGVELTGIPHKFIRGTRGGIMHHKFCIIDNQIVITGSYNWSTNAEIRNDENVTILKDPARATEYSVQFRDLNS